MSDERGPVFKRGAAKRPVQDRDVYTAKTPRGGVPEFVCEDITSQYEGSERARMRSLRPTEKRFAKLEEKSDEQDKKHEALVDIVTETRVMVSEMRGELRVLPKLVDALQSANERREEDQLDEKKHRRERVTKIIAAVLSGGFVMAILQKLVL